MEYQGNGQFSLALDEFDTFNMTPEQIRELGLAHNISSGPGLDSQYMPTTNELNVISNMVHEAVSKGQLLSFGYWPNDFIKATARRAGKLYIQSALAHPFRSPYIIMHSWDDLASPLHKVNPLLNKGPITSAYLVNPYNNSGDGICIDFEAMELEEVVAKGNRCLGVGDRVTLDATKSIECDGYAVNVVAFAYRFPVCLTIQTSRQ